MRDCVEFAFYLNNNQAGMGELFLGGYNPAHFSGTLFDVPLISDTYWEVCVRQRDVM